MDSKAVKTMSENTVKQVIEAKNFDGKVVLITGSSWGMGRAIAKEFAQLGARVVITGRNVERVESVAQEVRQLSPKGLKPLTVVGDLTKDEDVKQLLNKTIETYGQLDILINNAGLDRESRIKDSNFMEIFDNTFAVNVRAHMLLIHLSVPYLEKTKGTIITTGAIKTPLKYWGTYDMSKSALLMMTQTLAIELSPNIRVNAVSPGFTLTDGVKAGPIDEKTINEMTKKVPFQRWGDALDIAKAVIFLASKDAQFVTGANLVVDGGLSQNFI